MKNLRDGGAVKTVRYQAEPGNESETKKASRSIDLLFSLVQVVCI